MAAKNSLGKNNGVNCPEDLIDGMEQIMQELGTFSSFLDIDQINNELSGDHWSIIFKGVLNGQTYEAQCFQRNMERAIKEQA